MLEDKGKFASKPLIAAPLATLFHRRSWEREGRRNVLRSIEHQGENNALSYRCRSRRRPAAHAQTVAGISKTDQAGVTTTLFSVQPQRQVSAADYVKMSADALNYRISASEIALRKAERADVKAFAKADLAEAKKQQASLYAALSNKDRKINKPTLTLSSKRAAFIDLLKKSKNDFDNLYLTQMADEAPSIWALQKGYSLEGSDPALRQVATLWVPTVEASYTEAKGLTPAAVASR